MVRLKVPGGGTSFGISLFQFLYGAIKSADVATASWAAALFQFLYGAIKSRKGSGITHTLSSNFNSYMVRLKVKGKGIKVDILEHTDPSIGQQKSGNFYFVGDK